MPHPRMARALLTMCAAALLAMPTLASAQDASSVLPITLNAGHCLVGTPRTVAEIVKIRDGLVLRTGDVRLTVVHIVPGGTVTSSDTIPFARQDDGFVISGAVLSVVVR